MNWITKCNQLEKENKDVIYESCCKLIDCWESFINNTINTACNKFFQDKGIENIIDKMITSKDSECLSKLFLDEEDIKRAGLDKEDIFSVFDEVIDYKYFTTFLQKIVIESMDENDDLLEKCIDCYYDEITIIKDCLYEMSIKCLPYIRNEKELYLMSNRLSLFSRTIDNQYRNLNSELKYGFAQDFSRCIKELVEEKVYGLLKSEDLPENNNDTDDTLGNNKSIPIKKIFDYKEMESLALKNGFSYKWSNGSHNIYEHNKSKKIVVIPAHELGLGLSIKIQKQIQSNTI